MDTWVALASLGALLAFATLLGAALAARKGRVRRAEPEHAELVEPAELGAGELGAEGTVVQFSTAYCARCPATRRLIADAVSDRRGVGFIHVDVTDRPRLAAKYRLRQTPTVLILDRTGRTRTRLSGAFTRDALASELESIVGGTR